VFTASDPFLLFDYFRVPYVVEEADEHRSPAPHGFGSLRPLEAAGASPCLFWPAHPGVESGWLSSAAGFTLDSIPLPGRVLADATVAALVAASGGRWQRLAEIRDEDGSPVSAVWLDEDGSVMLPFDPAEVMTSCWSESYRTVSGRRLAGRAKQGAMKAYYRLRPLLPRSVQIGLRRAFTRVQARVRFPRWPAEPALHDLYDWLFARVAELAGQPVPRLAAWPNGHSWSLVLTHDVETAVGRDHLLPLQDIEARLGFRSSWNFVPLRYETPPALIADLAGNGWEVGVHGLYHDGRDLESRATLEKRLPAIRNYAARWKATGFRSPATHRAWDLMPLLGFDHDSSYPDTDPFEPQSGGCCTWLPFFNQGLVELPITLVQDHTLFVLLRKPDESLWLEKAGVLRDRGGMALLVTHPDYMLDELRLGAYKRFLERFHDDETVWKALPSEVSSWWRRRAQTRIEPADGGWRLVGPAAVDGRVEVVGG
jgi:hypothetical protein